MDAYLAKAASFASEATRFSKRLTQEIVERSKDISIPGHIYDTSDEKFQEIRTNLASRYDKERIDGLKRLIAMISKGRNVKEFFPDVVKLVAASSLEVRKLVYIYLLRYAEEEPDLALLSINTFQKDLTDRNPLIRAMAVRVLSSIRVQVIVPIIMLSLKKALTDLSPYVRKAAANALPKIYSLDPAQLPYLIELIEGLLNDKSTLVLGSAVTSMMEICPERLDLIHKHYRKLCRVLVDANEWEQIAIMTLLGKYVRLFFDRPDDVEDTQALQVMDSHQHSLFSSESNSEFEIKHVQESIKNSQPRNSLDPDHELFLIACEPLLNSRNTSVVLTAIQIFYHQAPRSYLSRGIRALMRLLRTSKEERYITLRTISTIASRCPQAFEPYLKHFFVFEGEPKFISDMKLELLCTVATEERAKEIVREFKEYVHSPDKHMVIRSVQVLGRLCSKIPMVTEEVLSLLMTSISHRDEEILSQTILTLLTLLHQHPASMTPIALRRLARALNHVTTPRARAAVVWLIGEYHHITTTTAVDVLRILAKGFADEADVVRAAIVGLAVKLAVAKDINENARDRCNLLVDYVFELARWDPTWDVRDRTRLLQSMVPLKSKPVSLVDVAENAESGTGEAPPRDVETSLRRHARDILLSRKSTFTSSRTADVNVETYTLTSLSHAFSRRLRTYAPLPPWSSAPPELRIEAGKQRGAGDPSSYVSGHGPVQAVSAVPEVKLVSGTSSSRRIVDLNTFWNESDSASSTDESDNESESTSSESDETGSEDEGAATD